MQQKDALKIEVWVDGRFYGKHEIDPAGYNLTEIIRYYKDQAAKGLIPSANVISVRKGL
jgi:hypothetical protein